MRIFLYDGACGFCRFWVERWRRRGEPAGISFFPYQETDLQRFALTPDLCQRSAYFVDSEKGKVFFGARAVLELCARASGWYRLLLFLYLSWEPIEILAERTYRFVADHRSFFSLWTVLLFGRNSDPPRYERTLDLFLRGLGLIYLSAFLSFWVQGEGLIGVSGILPWPRYLMALQQGGVGFFSAPTLFWFFQREWFFHLLCGSGALISLLIVFGIFHPLLLFSLYFFYLSLVIAGGIWMSFQWDHLLLEIGFLSIVLTSPRFSLFPTPWGVFLVRWLLFRLLFCSGMVKLLSHDPTWRGLTALLYHFETQPLPSPLSPWVHHLSPSILKTICALVFFCELILPWGIFGPRRVRAVTGVLEALFQVFILFTGNYGFFNLLTILLCLFTLDDSLLPFSSRRIVSRPPPPFWRGVVYSFCIFLFLLSLHLTLRQLHLPDPLRPLITPIARVFSSFRLVSTYGLFAVMTTERYEILFYGSEDGVRWKPFTFRYKPDDPEKPLPFLPLHMPRLDWLLWFASLRECSQYPWVYWLEQHLLWGNPKVLSLLAPSSFTFPLRAVRSEKYLYRFNSSERTPLKKRTWERTVVGPYCPPVTR